MIHLVPDEQPRLGIDAAKETANHAYTRARAAQRAIAVRDALAESIAAIEAGARGGES